MSRMYRSMAWATLILMLIPGNLQASADNAAPTGSEPASIWRDKPLRPMPISPLAETSPRVLGTANVLMLCIEFSDVKHSGAHTPAFFDNLADGPGNSMAAYFTQASTGRFTIAANSSGWYTSTQTMQYYGAPSGGQKDNPLLYQLVTEAVNAANPAVNFADYDSDQDGWVDYLQIIHAGSDQAMSGSQNDIWSEMYYDFDTPTVDGKKVGLYSMVSEHDPMGVLAHEFGHQLGLPDLYDTDGPGSGGETDGAGIWDIMAAGAYLGNGDFPSLPSAWSRALVGWANVVLVTADRYSIPMLAATQNATILRINKHDLSNEYFLVECRYNIGFDSYLPGSGLLIWHIDDSKGTVNLNDLENRPGKKRVTLEEAHGGTQHLDRAGLKLFDPFDPWSNSNGGFSPTSDPNTTAYLDGRHSFISVRKISPAGATMAYDVLVDTRVYDLRMNPSSTQFNIDPGVTTQFSVDLYNRGSLENYTLAVEGTFTGWFSAEPGVVRLGPQSAAGITVSMRPPVTAPAGTTFEDSFRATAESDRTQYVSFKFTVKVNPKQKSMFSPSQDVELFPGEVREVNLTVSNLGNLADAVTMSIQGTGTGWVSYNGQSVFYLSAGANASLNLRAAIPFGTEQNARAYVLVGGRSKDGSVSVQATINLTARSSPYIEFEGAAEVHVRPEVQSTFSVHLVNSGTADAVLSLTTAADEGWFANLTQTNILIPAWGSEDVLVALTAPAGTAAGYLTAVNLTATAGAYQNMTSIPVTVDQVFSSALEGADASAAVWPGIQYDYRFQVNNTGNGNDDMAFRIIEGENGEGWSGSIDSQVARLGPGQAAPVVVSVTAPPDATAGAIWILQLEVRHSSQNVTVFDIVSTVARTRAVTFSAATKAKSGDPGETLRFTLSAGNAGNAGESVLFSAPRQDGLSFEFSEPDYSFNPGEKHDLQLSCRILAGATAGLRQFNLTAAARDNASVNSTVELRLTVNAVFLGELQFPQVRLETRAGGSATFQCTVVNRGNTRDTFTLSKISGTMEVRFDPPSVTLAPGTGASVNITVTVPSDDGGGERAFKVAARSSGKAAEIAQRELTVEVPARPGGGGNPLLVPFIGVAVAVAVAAVAAAWFLRRRKNAR